MFVRRWIYYGLKIRARALNVFVDVMHKKEDEPDIFFVLNQQHQMEVEQNRESIAPDSTNGTAAEDAKRSRFDVTFLFRCSRVFDHLQHAPRPSEQQHRVMNPVQRANKLLCMIQRCDIISISE